MIVGEIDERKREIDAYGFGYIDACGLNTREICEG